MELPEVDHVLRTTELEEKHRVSLAISLVLRVHQDKELVFSEIVRFDLLDTLKLEAPEWLGLVSRQLPHIHGAILGESREESATLINNELTYLLLQVDSLDKCERLLAPEAES